MLDICRKFVVLSKTQQQLAFYIYIMQKHGTDCLGFSMFENSVLSPAKHSFPVCIQKQIHK